MSQFLIDAIQICLTVVIVLFLFMAGVAVTKGIITIWRAK